MKQLIFFAFLFVFHSCSDSSYNGDIEYSEYQAYPSTAGAISSEEIEGLEGADVDLDASEFKMAMDNTDGSYEFEKGQSSGQSHQQPSQIPSKQQAQKIIRTARMTMEVKKYEAAVDSLSRIIERFDARVEDQEESRHSYRIESHFTIRVAPEKLEPLMEAIEAIGIDVDNKAINSRDVTRRYVDLETRLASKRAVIKRYREILKTAKTVKEILDVENHLREVVEEVESTEAQLRHLKDKVGESTLNLDIYQDFDRPNVKKETFWSRIGSALGNGWRGGQEFIIGVVSLWPFWIILGGVIWGVRRWWKRRKSS